MCPLILDLKLTHFSWHETDRGGSQPLWLPKIPSGLVSLRLRIPRYSISGCSKSSFILSRQSSGPADNSPWRTSPSAINLRFCSETPSGHG